MLFDASEFFDSDAIVKSLNEINEYRPPVQNQQPQMQERRTQPMNSAIQAPQATQTGDGGLIGTILSIFM